MEDRRNKNKKILGYDCIKATANFRGSEVTAYFTKELPYSAGPFKFFGLPGVILDIREDNKNFNIWKAEKWNYQSIQPLILPLS
jgi:GLPGLI family protein